MPTFALLPNTAIEIKDLIVREDAFGGFSEAVFKTPTVKKIFPGRRVQIVTENQTFFGVIDQAYNNEVRVVSGRKITDGFVIGKRYFYNSDFSTLSRVKYPNYGDIEDEFQDKAITFRSQPDYTYSGPPSHLNAYRWVNENPALTIARVLLSGYEDVNRFFSHALLSYSTTGAKTGLGSNYGTTWSIVATNVSSAKGLLIHVYNRLTGSYSSAYWTQIKTFQVWPYVYPANIQTLLNSTSGDSLLVSEYGLSTDSTTTVECDIFVENATQLFDWFAKATNSCWTFSADRRVSLIPLSSLPTFIIEDYEILNFSGTVEKILYFDENNAPAWLDNPTFNTHVYQRVYGRSGYVRRAYYGNTVPTAEDFYKEVIKQSIITVTVKTLRDRFYRSLPAIYLRFPFRVSIKGEIVDEEAFFVTSIERNYTTGEVTLEMARVKDAFLIE